MALMAVIAAVLVIGSLLAMNLFVFMYAKTTLDIVEMHGRRLDRLEAASEPEEEFEDSI